MNLNSKVIPGSILMELETTTAYATNIDSSDGTKPNIKNITAKNVIPFVCIFSHIIFFSYAS